MSDEYYYLLAINRLESIGPVLSKNLIAYCGSAKSVFEANHKELRDIPGINKTLAQRIHEFDEFDRVEEELKFIKQNNIQVVSFFDRAYPNRLKQLPSAPIVLFQKGAVDLNASRIISVIGTRKCSAHAREFTKEVIEKLAVYNPVVISGLAHGIDAVAHRTCLEQNLLTIGVLGHGLNTIYPAANRKLSRQIEASGALLTELQRTERADKENFPKRNRIVAGMSDAVIVVESPVTGGSMITARVAFDFDREVMAVPGRANESLSAGCNKLIKEHKAHLVESAEDIARILNWDIPGNQTNLQFSLPVHLSKTEQLVFDTIREIGCAEIDQLIRVTKVSTSVLAYTLLELEFRNIVRALPGKRFELV